MSLERAFQNPTSFGQTSMHFARVSEIDTAMCRARVNVQELGTESYWLPVLQYRTGVNKSYWMPSIGEFVACLLGNDGSSGVILGGIYSQADIPPANTPTELHITTSKVVIIGDLDITGNINHVGNNTQTGDLDQTGVTTISGTGSSINGKQIAVVGAPVVAGESGSVVGSGQ